MDNAPTRSPYKDNDFENEINEILEFQESEKTNNPHLTQLAEETGDKLISTSNVTPALPTPYTKDEAREIKLNGLLEK